MVAWCGVAHSSRTICSVWKLLGYCAFQRSCHAFAVTRGFASADDLLSEAAISPQPAHSRSPCLQAQREALDKQLRYLSNSHVVFEGLQHFKRQRHPSRGPRTPKSQLEVPVVEPIAIQDIPGLGAAGWSQAKLQPPKCVAALP